MSRTFCFRGLLLVLILVLLTPPAFAAGPREEGPSFRGVLSALWQTVTGLLPGLGTVSETSASTSGDAHGTMDPNG